MDNSQGWVIHERQLSRSSKQTKKPLPRRNLSGAYIGRTSAFHQSGIREPGPHPRGGGSSTVFFISRLCPKSSSGTLACGLALTEAQGNDKDFGCCSRRRGRRICAKRKLCGGVLRGQAGNEVLQCSAGAFSLSQETKVLGGYCGGQKPTQRAAGDYVGERCERGEKVHRSLHT